MHTQLTHSLTHSVSKDHRHSQWVKNAPSVESIAFFLFFPPCGSHECTWKNSNDEGEDGG